MSTLTQLEYLVAVAKQGHFGRAAKACYVSQPSLSAQIKRLEEELGVELLDRSAKPIVATQAGQEIIRQAKVILREHRKLSTIADQESTEPKGEFRLAVIPTLAPSLIPRFVGGFSRGYPKVMLHVDEQKTENILSMLHEGTLDAGLLVTPIEDSQLETRHLFYEPFYCYLNKDNPLAKRKYLAESDLDPAQVWLLAEGHCFRQQVLKLCGSGSEFDVLPNVSFESGSLDTLRRLVQANTGFTLLPQLSVMDLSQAEQQAHVRKFRKPIPTREVSLIHARSAANKAVIEALHQSILAQLPSALRGGKRKDIEVIEIY